MDRRLLRPGALIGHLLVLVAVLVCLRLGWWQYERAHEATGTAQNWGYALLWPCFAVAFVYMWVKFLRLEHDRDVDEEAAFDEGLAEILGDAGSGDGDRPTVAPTAGANAADDAPEPDRTAVVGPPTAKAGPPSRSVIISVATVGDDDEDDPELAAYNRALAELAERDRNGAS